MITVTHNHIMIVYDKDMNELKYKTAENVIKNEDYFNTLDGLYQVKEIKIFDMKYKYALGYCFFSSSFSIKRSISNWSLMRFRKSSAMI